MADASRALTLIKAEHAAIVALFGQADGADAEKLRAVVDETLLRLDIHAQVKDELLYPALEGALGEDALAEVSGRHEDAEEAIAEFEDANENVDAEAFAALGERMRAHFDEEEQAIEALVHDREVDLDAIGAEMEKRREELRAEVIEGGDVDQ